MAVILPFRLISCDGNVAIENMCDWISVATWATINYFNDSAM